MREGEKVGVGKGVVVGAGVRLGGLISWIGAAAGGGIGRGFTSCSTVQLATSHKMNRQSNTARRYENLRENLQLNG